MKAHLFICLFSSSWISRSLSQTNHFQFFSFPSSFASSYSTWRTEQHWCSHNEHCFIDDKRISSMRREFFVCLPPSPSTASPSLFVRFSSTSLSEASSSTLNLHAKRSGKYTGEASHFFFIIRESEPDDSEVQGFVPFQLVLVSPWIHKVCVCLVACFINFHIPLLMMLKWSNSVCVCVCFLFSRFTYELRLPAIRFREINWIVFHVLVCTMPLIKATNHKHAHTSYEWHKKAAAAAAASAVAPELCLHDVKRSPHRKARK